MKNILTLILALTGNYIAGSSYPLHLSTVSPEFAQFHSGLYAIGSDGSASLLDGTLTQYDTGYSNNIDGMDARKMFNPGENFGMIRGTTVLIVERRHTFQNNDTIFFKMWNMRMITYKLELIAYHLNTQGRIGILKDKYLKKDTPIRLNDTTNINFSVTSDPASWASDRFMVILETPSLSVMPLTFTSFRAYQQKNSIKIDWTTSNESGMKEYNIEKSSTGNHFTKISVVRANNSALNNYTSIDVTPVEGYNLYRIRSISNDDKSEYSDIVKVYIGGNHGIQIFPNPVIGNNIHLQILNELPGTYEIKLLNSLGQIFLKKSIQYTGGIITEDLRLEQSFPKGIYQVEIKTPSGQEKLIRVLF